MDILIECCISLLETIFIFVGLLILHSIKPSMSSIPFYLSLGLLVVFAQFAEAAGVSAHVETSLFDLNFSSSMMLLSILGIIIVVYLADGLLETQRLIFGLMAALTLYVYLAYLTSSQLSLGHTIYMDNHAQVIAELMRRSIRQMSSMVVSFTFDIFLLPFFVQYFHNRRLSVYITVPISLLIIQTIDAVISSAICYWGESVWLHQALSTIISHAVLTLPISLLAGYYLSHIDLNNPGRRHRPIDIFIAFFATYGRAKQLEKSLKETERRYRLLVQNAIDMILIMDEKGIIIDCNSAASRMLGLSGTEIRGMSLWKLTGIPENIWNELTQISDDDTNQEAQLQKERTVKTSCIIAKTGLTLELSISNGVFYAASSLIVFGHDITERIRFEKVKEELHNQAAHSQRLESIGRLAGGIAHDFNNYLQAIQGNLDMILYMHPTEDEDVNRYLNKIDTITTKAATLTQQLLGFARKGNYNETEIHLKDLVQSSVDLFLPDAAAMCSVQIVQIPNETQANVVILGDMIQLQQTILNILFNARDAMSVIADERSRKIIISYGLTSELSLQFNAPQEAKVMPNAEYCVIRIQDTGPGIPESVRIRIFDPFFSTKPVGKGTGMGLAMAYGTMLAHKGWIQCGNGASGAEFCLIFPAKTDLLKDKIRIEDNSRLMGI